MVRTFIGTVLNSMGVICGEERRQKIDRVILVKTEHIETCYRRLEFLCKDNGRKRTHTDVTTTAKVQSMEFAAVGSPTYPQAALPIPNVITTIETRIR